MSKRNKAIIIIAVFAVLIFALVKIFDDRGFGEVAEECDYSGRSIEVEGRSLIIEGQFAYRCATDVLDIPERITSKVYKSSALDGWQSDSFNGLDIEWSYSGFSGLDVIISR